MKHLFFTLALLLGAAFGLSARDAVYHDSSVLPVAAQITLQNNFKSNVKDVKVEKSFGHIEDYEVTLADGTEITFNLNGIWTDVESATNDSVPDGIIAQPILDYVAQAQPDAKVIGIERERTGYFDVTLSNGVEMRFNNEGHFLKYDK